MLHMEAVLLIIAFAGQDDSLDGEDLSVEIRKGNQQAFRTFYDRHYPGLYRFMVSRGMSHDEAADLVQNAFVMIWERRSDIDEKKSLRAFLFQIAYSRMLNHITYQSKFTGEVPQDVQAGGIDMTGEADSERNVHYSELLDRVRKVIAAMPEKRATVFELCFMKQFSYKEAAETLGVSLKTVENHMALAFRNLRSELVKIYGDKLPGKE
jgi:RNA polymerase sigma-70 factor, ECF subfamily